jgi:hypothetical protein
MPVIDQELQEFEALLEYMEQAELKTLGFPTAGAGRGERGLQLLYEKADWVVVPGIPGHTLTSPGPDLIAWKKHGEMEVRIIDNKSGKQEPVTKASALMPQSLMRNLGPIIWSLRVLYSRYPRVTEAKGLLWKTLGAVIEGKPLPPPVRLYVTNFDGQATRIAPALQRRSPYSIVVEDLRPRITQGVLD